MNDIRLSLAALTKGGVDPPAPPLPLPLPPAPPPFVGEGYPPVGEGTVPLVDTSVKLAHVRRVVLKVWSTMERLPKKAPMPALVEA